jgi:hypothetical protein
LFEAFDNSNNLCVRITIDGAVVVNSQGKMYAGLISDKSGAIEGSYWGTWDFQTNTFVPINTTTTPTLYGNSAGGAVVSGVVLVPDGLKFNTSCLIEVMQIYNATAQNVAYSLKYAM